MTVLDGTAAGQTDWAVDADGISDVNNRTLYAGYHLDTETASTTSETACITRRWEGGCNETRWGMCMG